MIPDSKKLFLAKYGSSNHITELMNDPSDDVRMNLHANPLFPREEMEKTVSNRDDWVGALGLTHNTNLPAELVHKLVNHPDQEVKTNALLHKNVDPNDVYDALRNPRHPVAIHTALVKYSPHIIKDDLDHVISSKNSYYHSTTKDEAFDRMVREYPESI